MPIQQIVEEQLATGEIDPELAATVTGNGEYAGSSHREQPKPSGGSQKTTVETDYGTLRVHRRDIELMVDVAILIMLILIWSRV